MSETMEELDAALLRAANEGRFADAQIALDAIRHAAEARGDLLEAEILTFRGSKLDDIVETQRRQLLEFTTRWEGVMAEYESKAKGSLAAMRDTHSGYIREQEELFRAELTRRKVHYSRRVLHLRDAIQRLSEAKHFREADDTQKCLLPMEREELRKFDETLSIEFAAQSKRWREKCRKEMATLRYKIEQGRLQHREQRRQDYDNLILRHHNTATEAQQRTKTKLSKARRDLQRQRDSFKSAPRRTHVQYADFTDVLCGM